MEIEVKTLSGKISTLTLLVFSSISILISCSSKVNENPNSESNDYAKDQISEELKNPENGILWTQVPPDKQRQTHYKSGRVVYEADFDKEGKISSQVHPKLDDAFLHEDKFYLKVILPFYLAGELKASTNLRNPLYITKIDSLMFQVALHEALDLEEVEVTLQYLPASNDSILVWEKTYEIPILP